MTLIIKDSTYDSKSSSLGIGSIAIICFFGTFLEAFFLLSDFPSFCSSASLTSIIAFESSGTIKDPLCLSYGASSFFSKCILIKHKRVQVKGTPASLNLLMTVSLSTI
jgi:hypothetical protein